MCHRRGEGAPAPGSAAFADAYYSYMPDRIGRFGWCGVDLPLVEMEWRASEVKEKGGAGGWLAGVTRYREEEGL